MFQCSSASRKFLNRSFAVNFCDVSVFQCSSASRKFLNRRSASEDQAPRIVSVLFSEPKIPQCAGGRKPGRPGAGFQCSSASRKFLNAAPARPLRVRSACFSALQRAENSSIVPVQYFRSNSDCVSVLFSEPKIPQCTQDHAPKVFEDSFSALQRAENSSIVGYGFRQCAT